MEEYSASRVIRVVSVPAGHPYVRAMAVGSSSTLSVQLIDDPAVAGAPPGQWWPPVALGSSWIREHTGEADVLHVHFGLETLELGTLTAALDTAHDVGWPIVYTCHDLDNPHLTDQSAYHRQLDAVFERADDVVTLTEAAADEIRARWGREATILPHPRILAESIELEPTRRRSSALSLGLFLKDVRANVDVVQAVSTLISAVEHLGEQGREAAGFVWIHRDLKHVETLEAVRALAGASGVVDLVEHDRLGDAELAAALDTLDVCVLPYSHGTHSGWLELCWDLGVPVAAPAIGCYADQHHDASVQVFTPGSGASLAAAALAATGSSAAGSAARVQVRTERATARRVDDLQSARRQAELYDRLLARLAPASS